MDDMAQGVGALGTSEHPWRQLALRWRGEGGREGGEGKMSTCEGWTKRGKRGEDAELYAGRRRRLVTFGTLRSQVTSAEGKLMLVLDRQRERGSIDISSSSSSRLLSALSLCSLPSYPSFSPSIHLSPPPLTHSNPLPSSPLLSPPLLPSVCAPT
eukprot:767722-Hanusia_phi.AAC.3